MSNILVGIVSVVIVFFLVVLLGMQIQISNLTRRLDKFLNKQD